MTPNDPTPKVLIIDDETVNIKILSDQLKEDAKVLFATDGEKGISSAYENLPDLVLLDVMMPVMDGYEVCKRLKTNPKTKHIPIIFVTAMDHAQDQAAGLELGAVDYITKPFDPEIVKFKVNNHIRQAAKIAAATSVEFPVHSEQVIEDRRNPDRRSSDRRSAESASNNPAQKSNSTPLAILVASFVAIIAGVGGSYWVLQTEGFQEASNSQNTDTASGPATASVSQVQSSPSIESTVRTPVAQNQSASESVSQHKASPVSSQSMARIPTPTTPAAEQEWTSSRSFDISWVYSANCPDLPKVPWWTNQTHAKAAQYVNAKHNGNWSPYIGKWSRQRDKLQNIAAKGGTAVTPSGVRLKGGDLNSYIATVSQRVSVLRCLAAAAQNSKS